MYFILYFLTPREVIADDFMKVLQQVKWWESFHYKSVYHIFDSSCDLFKNNKLINRPP